MPTARRSSAHLRLVSVQDVIAPPRDVIAPAHRASPRTAHARIAAVVRAYGRTAVLLAVAASALLVSTHAGVLVAVLALLALPPRAERARGGPTPQPARSDDSHWTS